MRIPLGEGVSERIAATGEATYIPDVPIDPRVHPEGRKQGLSSGVRSNFGVVDRARRAHRFLQIDAPQIDAFGSSTRTLVEFSKPREAVQWSLVSTASTWSSLWMAAPGASRPRLERGSRAALPGRSGRYPQASGGIGPHVVKRPCDATAVPVKVDDAPAGGETSAATLDR